MDNQDWVALGDNTSSYPAYPSDPSVMPSRFANPTYREYELVSPPLPADLSHTEKPHEHYLERFQVYHERKGKHVPFDPADSIPAMSLEEKDDRYHFYVNIRCNVNQRRYPAMDFAQTTMGEPHKVMTNFSSPLVDFCRHFIGGTFYDGSEYDVSNFFPKLPEMQNILSLSCSLLSKMKNKETTGEQVVAFAKRLGIIAGAPSPADASLQPYLAQEPMTKVSTTGPTTLSGSAVERSLMTTVEHLGVLVECIEDHFKPIEERLEKLLKNGHIEYDLCIFLEQRSLHEIQRNSLVSVALRVFEYHQGVLFLTTNRIQTFDSAFLSRFSIAIKYPELNATCRFSVWANFLTMAGCTIVESMNASQLSQYKAPILWESIKEIADDYHLNGRTIKNVVKTAQALAPSSYVTIILEELY